MTLAAAEIRAMASRIAARLATVTSYVVDAALGATLVDARTLDEAKADELRDVAATLAEWEATDPAASVLAESVQLQYRTREAHAQAAAQGSE